MTQRLRPFQERGRDFLSVRSGALLGDQPGLGKTAQAIAAADDRAANRIVVLCPASLKTNWAREIRKFSFLPGSVHIPSAKELLPVARWTIINYDIAHLPAIRYQLEAPHLRPDLLLCDEMHRLKGGPDTAIGRAFLDSFAKSAGGVWGLSGTPAPNHLGELFWWISAVCPQMLKGELRDYYRFLARYTIYRDTPYGPRVQQNKNVDEFRAAFAEYFLRRRVVEVMPELPRLEIQRVCLDAKKADLRKIELHPEYEKIKTLAAALAEGDADLPADEYATTRRLTGILKAPLYAELLGEELDAAPERKIVVMCWHREVIDMLSAALSRFGVVVVHGGVSTSDRQFAVDTFQSAESGVRVFIGQLQAAGEGLTLTAANQVDIVESNWVPKDIEQALRRVLRIGQTSDRCVGRFVSLGASIDELIDNVLERKTRLLVEVFD